jgi:large subunit ribosomal protein L10
MPNKKNIEAVENLKTLISDSRSIILTEYHGLDSNQMNGLRAKVKEAGGKILIAKNTLLKLALEGAKIKEKSVTEALTGPTAVILTGEDSISSIKAIYELVAKLELPKVKGGLIDGKFTPPKKIEILSMLPSREELLARVVGGLNAPLSGFVNVLSGGQRGLVVALRAIAEKKS